MKEFYIPPQLNISCFASREHLASLSMDVSLFSLNKLTNASSGETEPRPGDVFIPITPKK